MPDEILRPVGDPASIDTGWLQAALSAGGSTRGHRITDFEAEPVGTGQMGRSYRFRLSWDTDVAPLESVVVKLPSDDPTSRATGAAQGSYLREVRFYQRLAGRTRMRTPHCHWGDIDETTGECFSLVLEDMAPARQGDQIAGCTPDEAALALEELTRLHAPWWGDAALASMDFLQGMGEGGGALLQAVYQSLQPGFEARYAGRLDAESMRVCRDLGPRLGAWTQASSSPKTLTHGDYRLDNMLFGGSASPAPLCIVDWQTVGFGPGLGDAAYFMGAGLPTEMRRKHEERLLRVYHDGLVASGVAGYDWNACHRDYRLFTFAGVIMAVIASMIVEVTERGDEMFLAMASRHAAHALDLEAFSLLD